MTSPRDLGYLLIDLVAAILVVVLAVLPILLELGSTVTRRHRDATRLELGAELERLRNRIFFGATEPATVRISGMEVSCVRGVPVESRVQFTKQEDGVELLWHAGEQVDWIVLIARRDSVEERLMVAIPSR